MSTVSTMTENISAGGFRAKEKTPPTSAVSSVATRRKNKEKSSHDEAQLIERLKAGDERALEIIFELHSARVYGVAHKILGDVADAQEVVQDIFWTAFRKAKSFRGTARFSTWLYRLTVNAALGKIRSAKKRKEMEYEEYLPKFQEDGHHLVRPVVDWSDTLEEKYARQEVQALIAEALNQVKPIDKSVIVLSDLEGLSDRQIAAVLDLTVPAVKTRLHRTRLVVRGKLAVALGHSPT